MTEIKVIFLLSYDFEYIKYSLPCVYKDSSKILISIDKNRTSWAGNKYEFDEKILDWIKEFDRDDKVIFFQENFYIPTNTTMENETIQRQMSADYFGIGGWTIQLDVDEFFIDFKGFVSYLQNLPKKFINFPEENKICIAVNWLNLFKKDENGYFIVSKPLSPIRIATNYPIYDKARAIKSITLYSKFIIIHNTWARSKEEIKFKIENWGHNNDFDKDKFYKKWIELGFDNYKTYINFNPIKPFSNLGELEYRKYDSIEKLIEYYKNNVPKINYFKLKTKNIIQLIKYDLKNF